MYRKTLFCPGPALGLLFALFVLAPGAGLFAQASTETPAGTSTGTSAGKTAGSDLALSRISLFSSGVGYFEHTGTVTGSVELKLPFEIGAVNDALKSLTIQAEPAPSAGTDPGSFPSVRYPQADLLAHTLGSLKIDLSGNPGIGAILAGQQGAEIEVSAPNPIRGRIISVETRPEWRRDPGSPDEGDMRLSLYTERGIRLIPLRDIASFAFTDPGTNADITRALDLIGSSRDSAVRELSVSLPGNGRRSVSISYVIPSPVWKVSYRLDLSGERPFLQGWAIVDNNGNTDWNNVELSLLTGRPVSFIQALYPPYNLPRPVLPLAIAGIAEARTWDSGWEETRQTAAKAMFSTADESAAAPAPRPESMAAAGDAAPRAARAENLLRGGSAETTRAEAAGDQFEFIFKRPVSLRRGESLMLPLFEGSITAEKSLVFSGAAAPGTAQHPAISAELFNTTGMKLPAGPVTVYDGGAYAGDALLAFLPEQEKRIISYGDDLSVTGVARITNNRMTAGVRVSRGVMTISRKIRYEKTYTFRNASGEAKRLILEHPVTPGAALVEPASFTERTAAVYRFAQTLPADRELTVTVREESPLDEGISLSQLRLETFAAYASNQEIPPAVRAALQKAVDLKRKADETKQAENDLEARRTRLMADQDRIRRNLEAAGNQSPQGQEYLKRLVSLDAEIDALASEAETAAQNTRAAQREYENYLAALEL
ncbi:MAG: DUF4139 domain-containing protein [Spirochaetaceae bacterium]|jgi:hypothetical protein|nr:DUF4139 domain-containing protein [Spirochaetaceae bacterium]